MIEPEPTAHLSSSLYSYGGAVYDLLETSMYVPTAKGLPKRIGNFLRDGTGPSNLVMSQRPHEC